MFLVKRCIGSKVHFVWFRACKAIEDPASFGAATVVASDLASRDFILNKKLATSQAYDKLGRAARTLAKHSAKERGEKVLPSWVYF